MKKSVKILIGVIITLIILWVTVYFLNKFIPAKTIGEKEDYKPEILLIVKENGKKNIEKITVGELKSKYNYDIYYYGLDSVIIKINNEELDLKEALLRERVTMEQIIEKAKNDEKNGLIKSEMYKDGGSMEYYYDKYTIIKSNSLDGNRDVYIGIPEMTLNHVR